eukprot:CAMPEP_0177637144 /NCGR_PEP_ID=MMETSP0447-20121125/4816_1 /TAXON_ID=0 /ORGANISM="Stygamoeba regulata, Strain BSH-02190019" /LENGTH=302 /DNA_ID=CAMNT_0019139055 /DNA_START=749 /DNA_END=1657 /DNA_ORIENTATION=-
MRMVKSTEEISGFKSKHYRRKQLRVHELVPEIQRKRKEAEDDALPGEFDIYPHSDGTFHIPLFSRDPKTGGTRVYADDQIESVYAGPLQHSVLCNGFVVTEHQSSRIDLEKVQKAGLQPGPFLGRLKASLQPLPHPTEPGRMVHPDEVLAPIVKGRKIVILGDTANSSGIVRRAQNCDVVVHESTYVGNDIEFSHGHSCAAQAGAFARQVKAKSLILTHFGGRFPVPVCKNGIPTAEYANSANAAQEELGEQGDVILASDLMNVELKSPGRTVEECLFHPISYDALPPDQRHEDAKNFVDAE